MAEALEKHRDGSLNLVKRAGRLKTGHNLTVTVDQELGEVPLNVRGFSPARVVLVEHLLQNRSELVVGVKALETLLALEPGVKRKLVRAVYVALFELREVCAELYLAELGDLLVCSGSLVAELVARHVQSRSPCP